MPGFAMRGYDPSQSQDQQKEANWGSLDPRLLAEIGLVEEFMRGSGLDGQQVRDYWPAENGPTVKAVMTDGDLSQANSWSSPFEAQNLEQQFPTLAGGLQTGSLVDAIGNVSQGSLDGTTAALRGKVKAGGIAAVPAGIALAAVEAVRASGVETLGDLASLKGRSPFTKINSTMVYLGSAPVKISATLFFRAWKDAAAEVEGQVVRLQQWASPEYLSRSGAVENLLTGKGLANSLFPSKIPRLLYLRYGGRLYLPLVIESLDTPLVVERDQNANRLAVSVTVQFSTLTAWDESDIRDTNGMAGRLI